MKNRFVRILKEFIHHFPYSAVGVAACFGILLAVEKMALRIDSGFTFHIMHPLHIFLSALVTSAIFWKYEKGVIKALLIGLVGSVPICTLSDILIPYFGGLLFHATIGFHLCIIEEPLLVFPSALLGVVLGILCLKWVERGTEFAHLSHVLVSSLASLLYFVSFNIVLWEGSLWLVFGITLIAVWVPCCLSDIVFPLIFVRNGHVPCCGHHPHEI